MHLPNRNHKTDDGPVYARRQTPEEIQEMLTPKECTGIVADHGCMCRMCVPGPLPVCAGDAAAEAESPHPITGREIRERVENGEDGWGPRENWITEPIHCRDADGQPCPGVEMAPPHEVADMDAERKFREANEKLAHAAERRSFLDEQGFLIPFEKFIQEVADSKIDNHVPGAKADAGKLDYTLVPTELEEAVCEILMFGAKKYTRDGWRSVPNAHVRYLAALERHIKAFKRGEDCDPESGLHHLAHAACNLAFLLHFLRNGQDVGSWRFDEERYNGA